MGGRTASPLSSRREGASSPYPPLPPRSAAEHRGCPPARRSRCDAAVDGRRMMGCLRSRSARLAAGSKRSGVPTRLTVRSAMRWVTRGSERHWGAPGQQDDIEIERVERPQHFARASRSQDRSMSVRRAAGAGTPSGNLRDSVASEPTRSAAGRPPSAGVCPAFLRRSQRWHSMVENDLPGLRQMELPAPTLEQGVTEALLKFADLHREADCVRFSARRCG